MSTAVISMAIFTCPGSAFRLYRYWDIWCLGDMDGIIFRPWENVCTVCYFRPYPSHVIFARMPASCLAL